MMSQAPFTVLIPARMASSRLPDKPLADIAGLPMVVRVARQASQSAATGVVVACDDERVLKACEDHGVQAVMTRADHSSGSDRLAEATRLLGMADEDVVVNVQGDEPMIEPALINAVAHQLQIQPLASMSTAAHPIETLADFMSPHVVKVVIDAGSMALYFSRAPIPCWRDGMTPEGLQTLPSPPPLRHIGIYAYRARFLQAFTQLPATPVEALESLEQLRALWHGHRIAVHVSAHAPGPGIDTPEDLARARQLLQA